MDWQTVHFDWNRARAFMVAAEAGSFSAAARSLGTTQPTVGRQVAALEEELGVTLFERVGHRLQLTGAGADLLGHVRAMGQAAIRFSLSAAGQSSALEGPVVLAASEAVAGFLLPPIVAALRRDHPGITLELVVSNQASDLHRREADIAIRNFRPTQPDLYARKLSEGHAHFYAAPSYVARHGPLEGADELSRAEIFGFGSTEEMVQGLGAMGIAVSPAQFPIHSAHHLVQWELCKQGVGVCMMMEQVGDAEPAVVRVFQDLPSIPIPIWLVSHRELRTNPRIRLVFDRLAAGLER